LREKKKAPQNGAFFEELIESYCSLLHVTEKGIPDVAYCKCDLLITVMTSHIVLLILKR
jgi:hypothetical protein